MNHGAAIRAETKRRKRGAEIHDTNVSTKIRSINYVTLIPSPVLIRFHTLNSSYLIESRVETHSGDIQQGINEKYDKADTSRPTAYIVRVTAESQPKEHKTK